MDYKFSVIMDRILLAIYFVFILLSDIFGASGKTIQVSMPLSTIITQDTITDKQFLFNGRFWRNLYSNVVGGEFLISQDWLTGDVIINGIRFNNIPLRYDVYNDQLITMINQATYIQLNKELITGFKMLYLAKPYYFENFGDEGGSSVKGFAQVLYKGKTYLILKQKKQIKKLAVQNKYDEFYLTETLYILKNGTFNHISGKKDMLNVLSDKKLPLMNYIRENKLRIRKNKPESLIPLLEFYDKLK
jgi:hypothetical protein